MSVLVHTAQVATQTIYPILLLANVASLFYLRWQAVLFIRRRRANFDPIIAAEMIVAFGVLSLILGISAAVAPLFLGTATLAIDDLTSLAGIATPFLEGLATAGLAPFFAVLLRIEAAEHEARYDSATEMADLAVAAQDLTATIRGTLQALGELETSVSAAGRATRLLSEEISSESGRLSSVFSAGEAQLRTLGAAAESSGAQVARLAGETTRLNGAANEASTMLTALGDMIESVERFVKPSPPNA